MKNKPHGNTGKPSNNKGKLKANPKGVSLSLRLRAVDKALLVSQAEDAGVSIGDHVVKLAKGIKPANPL